MSILQMGTGERERNVIVSVRLGHTVVDDDNIVQLCIS